MMRFSTPLAYSNKKRNNAKAVNKTPQSAAHEAKRGRSLSNSSPNYCTKRLEFSNGGVVQATNAFICPQYTHAAHSRIMQYPSEYPPNVSDSIHLKPALVKKHNNRLSSLPAYIVYVRSCPRSAASSCSEQTLCSSDS